MTESNQPSKKNLKDIKAGEQVYIVWRYTRLKPEYHTVSKVGRRYGYADNGEIKYDLITGEGDSYGNGCKVYLSEREYNEHLMITKERNRLQNRLKNLLYNWNYKVLANGISPSLVSDLREVLDKHQEV